MTSNLMCGILFNADAVWLWSLCPNSWSYIYITGSDEVTLCQVHPALQKLLCPKCVFLATTFEGEFTEISPDYMWWISGRRWFIDLIPVLGDP
jgi:hypothetical protein